MKRHILAAAVATAAISVGTFTPASATLEWDPLTFDIACDGAGYVDFSVNVTGDPGESFDITVNGELFGGSPYAPGSYDLSLDGVDDGIYEIELTDHATGDFLDRLEFGVTCDGPIIVTGSECRTGPGLDGNYSVYYQIFDDSKSTFDVYIDGELVDANLTGAPDGATYGDELYPAGHEALVEVYWSDSDSEGPYFTATVVELCAEDDGTDSGAGLPDSGSNTTPLLLVATGLTLGGIALLGTRRTRRA